jgi:hypothetical protein
MPNLIVCSANNAATAPRRRFSAGMPSRMALGPAGRMVSSGPSHPSLPLTLSALSVDLIGAVLPFTPFTPVAHPLGFQSLPCLFFLALLSMVISYLALRATACTAAPPVSPVPCQNPHTGSELAFLGSLRCPRVLADQAVDDLSAPDPGGHIDPLAGSCSGGLCSRD